MTIIQFVPKKATKPAPEKVRVRLWSKDAQGEALEGKEIPKNFDAFVAWLEKQKEPGQLEVEIGGKWWMVKEGLPAFHWSGQHFDQAPSRLIPKDRPPGCPQAQGALQYEAWMIIARHHDCFYKGISEFSGAVIEAADGEAD